MKPVLPARIRPVQLGENSWLHEEANKDVFRLLLEGAEAFPSVILAFAAEPGLQEAAEQIASALIGLGINVFSPTKPCPINALAGALGSRNMPMGLYLYEAENGDVLMLPLASHGGPMDDKDIPATTKAATGRYGVLGSTELMDGYLRNLKQLTDPFPEKGIRLAKLTSSFPDFEDRLRESGSFSVLMERDENGPSAEISPDGQNLTITTKGGKRLPTSALVLSLLHYLIRVRVASGSILCPKGGGNVGVEICPSIIEIDGSLLEMSYRAGFSDLLLGWWEPGIFAHQGNGPFGDAFLSLIYLLEAWGTDHSAWEAATIAE